MSTVSCDTMQGICNGLQYLGHSSYYETAYVLFCKPYAFFSMATIHERSERRKKAVTLLKRRRHTFLMCADLLFVTYSSIMVTLPVIHSLYDELRYRNR